MLVRLILGGMLACSFIALDAAASADAADARVITGKTAQRYRIKLAVNDRSMKILRFNADLKCRDGSILTLIESGFLRTPLRNGGKFHDAQYGKTDAVFFRGRVKNGTVRGRMRLTDKLRKGVRCRSKWIKFSAPSRR